MSSDPKLKNGLNAWRHQTNHNRMLEFQSDSETSGLAAERSVKLAYFGSSAFRITTPQGLTIMIDPWRNIPTGKWDWYFHDFPRTAVDVGVSTHAHFDHDALHLLDASVLLDRLIGTYQFADVAIAGIADKHAIDASNAIYDMHLINSTFGGQNLEPPNNARSWDNCMIIVETGGLSILHWGDNRHNPPDDVWQRIGHVDILLLPVDDSQHVMGYTMTDEIIARLSPKIVVPHHYYVWNIVQRQSTLLPVDNWLATQPRVRNLEIGEASYSPETLPTQTTVDHFGTNVVFDVKAWHADNGLELRGKL